MNQSITPSDERTSRALERELGSLAFLNSLPVGIYCCDREGVVRHYNRRAAEIWGVGAREEDSPSVPSYGLARRIFDADGRELAREESPMAEALGTGVPVHDRHITIERPDGMRLSVLVNIDPIFDEGLLVGAVNCFQDVTALSQAVEALEQRTADLRDANERRRAGEQRFHDILEALPAAVYTTDAEGHVTYYNQACVETSGRTPVLFGDRWCTTWRLYSDDGVRIDHSECPMAIAIREQRPVRGTELIAERPDGSRCRLLPHPTPLFDAQGRLAGAVNMLLDISDRHHAEMQAAHLAAIVASSDDAIVSKSLDGKIRSWNAGASRLLGYEAEEMIGQPITKIIPPELLQEEHDILARLRRGQRIEHFETVRISKSGERVDLSLTVSPVHDRTGRVVGASKVARDIRERKRAEELQLLLISELNHRVKNTLATVQSIANQMIRNCRRPETFVEDLIGRIQALAHAHSLLTQSNWRGADILPLVQDQVLLEDNEDDRIVCSGPSVDLDPQPALHLALVLHELGTNARKYGALSVPDGRLDIQWEVRSAEGAELHIRWRESGGPHTSIPPRQGFGTTLIERSLSADGGRATLCYRATGLACDIMMPLPGKNARAETRSTSSSSGAGSDQPSSGSDRNVRVLLIEDEPLIGMDMHDSLEDAGYDVIGPAVTVDEARQLIETADFDLAMLDANMNGDPVDDLAVALTRHGKPFVFVTGYGREGLPKAFRQAPLLTKPLTSSVAIAAIERLLGIHEHGTRLVRAVT